MPSKNNKKRQLFLHKMKIKCLMQYQTETRKKTSVYAVSKTNIKKTQENITKPQYIIKLKISGKLKSKKLI